MKDEKDAKFGEIVDENGFVFVRIYNDKDEEMKKATKYSGFNIADYYEVVMKSDEQYFKALEELYKGKRKVLVRREDGVLQHYWVSDEKLEEFKHRIESRGGTVVDQGSSDDSKKPKEGKKKPLKIKRFDRFYKIETPLGTFRLDAKKYKIGVGSRHTYEFGYRECLVVKGDDWECAIDMEVEEGVYFDLEEFLKAYEIIKPDATVYVRMQKYFYDNQEVLGLANRHGEIYMFASTEPWDCRKDLTNPENDDCLAGTYHFFWLHYARGLRFRLVKCREWSSFMETLVHELGHINHHKMSEEDKLKAIELYDAYKKSGRKFITDYSSTNVWEFIAENYVAYNVLDKDVFIKHIGEDVYEFIDKKVAKGRKAKFNYEGVLMNDVNHPDKVLDGKGKTFSDFVSDAVKEIRFYKDIVERRRLEREERKYAHRRNT